MANKTDRLLIIDIVKKYAELVIEEIQIERVYIFGSYIKGTNNDHSDIDVAIVGDGFVGDPVDDTFKLLKIRRKVDKRIEPHPFKTSDFDDTNPYIKEIIKTGIRVV